MKSISDYGIDGEFQAKARTLEKALGIRPKSKTKYEAEFRTLCGVWLSSDLDEFNAATRDFRAIDKTDWQ